MTDHTPIESMRQRERIALATAAAMFVAGVLLVTVVLPAEYGVDPTGTGRALGLTQMAGAGADVVPGQPVVTADAAVVPAEGASQLVIGAGGRPTLAYGQPVPAAQGADGEPVLEWNRAGADHQHDGPYRRHVRTFALAPGEGMEFKYRLEKNGGFVYAWTSTGKVQVDFHGEPDGHPKGFAEFYDQAERDGATGTFVAPAPGIHGWYWKNLTSDPITITLNTAGYFQHGIEFRKSGRTEVPIPE
jgi:hypothetical protein